MANNPLINIVKIIIFFLAGLWAIGASINLLITPLTVQVQEVEYNAQVNETQSSEVVVKEISWYEAQGVWGIVVVITFAFMYTMIAVFAFLNYRIGLILFSILGGGFTILAALSIGGLYAPSLAGVLLGWVLLGVEGYINKRQRTATLKKDASESIQ